MSFLSWLRRLTGHADESASSGSAAATVSPVRQDTGFAIGLYDALSRRHENLVFSPYSAWAVLEMACAGARGETAEELRRVLHVGPGPTPVAARREDFRHPARAGSSLQIAIANSMWTQEGSAILGSYLEALGERGGAIFAVDFADARETARSQMNDWVEKQTEQRIRDLIGPGSLDALTRFVLVNAVYFRGAWEVPFDPEATVDEPFNLSGGGRVTAHMMHQHDTLWYTRADGWQAVDLCYQDCNLAMLLLVPDQDDGLSALEHRLDLKTIDECARAMRQREIRLALPRFKIEQSMDLTGPLQALGLSLAFDPARADFSGIDGRTPPDPQALCLSKVIHKAFVEVDEAGTEAAAASAAVLTLAAALRPPPVPTVRADHPFVYAIRERRSGELLFLGRVMDPTR